MHLSSHPCVLRTPVISFLINTQGLFEIFLGPVLKIISKSYQCLILHWQGRRSNARIYVQNIFDIIQGRGELHGIPHNIGAHITVYIATALKSAYQDFRHEVHQTEEGCISDVDNNIANYPNTKTELCFWFHVHWYSRTVSQLISLPVKHSNNQLALNIPSSAILLS
jgi:hypothetical protein